MAKICPVRGVQFNYCVDWEFSGSRMKSYIVTIPGNTHWSRRIFNTEYYFRPGYSYSPIASGTLGARKIDNVFVLGHKGPVIFPRRGGTSIDVAGIFNTRLIPNMLRVIAPQLGFEVNHLLSLPRYEIERDVEELIAKLSATCVANKDNLLLLNDIIEKSYAFIETDRSTSGSIERISAVYLSICEAFLERIIFQAYNLTDSIISNVFSDTNIPAGWYPFIAGYDTLPTLSTDLDLPLLPQELLDYLPMHKRINLDDQELARIKASLRNLYEAGPGAKNVGQEENDEPAVDNEGEEEIASGSNIPIPTETFLDELSVKIQIHPISVYWLLEELKSEGAQCKAEELRLLEDRLSVLILRLLGHRWPKQLETGESIPAWADSDGIIPIVEGTGEATLAEQVRTRLRVEDGELGVQQSEALLTELTGQSLEEWLRRKFFSRHVSQFKSRPIAWHLASTPIDYGKKKRGGSQRSPAFECLLFYHACSGDALARIRTQYVEPLLRVERQKMQDASLFQDETTSMLANERVQELEAFVEKLRLIEEKGFACPELDTFMTKESLDRWSGDGYLAPASREEPLRNERAWHVDINDGVRVNIAPLQLAGVLVSDVLKVADAKKALADRARWRADERRWVRDGKLPRCGWMDESVPESPRWTEREPERVAEQIKLEQKRQALQSRRAEEVEV